MFAAYVRLEDDNTDWFDGLVDFPIVPPIGSTIRVADRNANIREWVVRKIVVQGRPQASESPYKPELQTILICAGY